MGAKHRNLVEESDLGLTRSENAILACIADEIRKGEEHSFPGLKKICMRTKYKERYVQYTLRALERKGFLRTPTVKGGWRYHTVYVIPGIMDGAIIPEPPGEGEGPERAPYVAWQDRPAEQRLTYCRAIYKRLADDAPRKQYWADEIAALEKELASADQAPVVNTPKPEVVPHLPALVPPEPEPEPLQPLQAGDKDGELLELEALYAGYFALQSEVAEGSAKYQWYARKMEEIRTKYNEMLDDRGIVAIDAAPEDIGAAMIDEELESQIIEYQRIVTTREAALRATKPNTNKYEDRRKRRDEALTILNDLQMKRGGKQTWQSIPITPRSTIPLTL